MRDTANIYFVRKTEILHASPRLVRFALLLLAIILVAGCRNNASIGANFDGVGINGTQQLGRCFSIGEFYVNGYYGGNVGWEGGGGSNTCCVMLPKVWRPSLSVDLKWTVVDRSEENPEETEKGIYKSLKYSHFRAQVPVEKYESPEQLNVHFFPDGRARVLIGGPLSQRVRDDPNAAALATKGKSIPALFTQAELDDLQREHQASIKKYGDWR